MAEIEGWRILIFQKETVFEISINNPLDLGGTLTQ